MKYSKFGIIGASTLNQIRVELNPEENVKDFFTVLIRKLNATDITTDDEIFSNRSTTASLEMLSKAFSEVGIKNAVKLIVNDDTIFEDLHGVEDDLDNMMNAVNSANILYLNSVTIIMEDTHESIHYTYNITIHKNIDNSVEFFIDVESDIDIDEQSFSVEVEKFIEMLKRLGAEFK